MSTYTRAIWLSLAFVASGCGEEGFNGSSGFRGQSNVSDDRYESIFLSQGHANSFTDTFIQGESSEENQEAFVQGEKFGALDIMVVIDNSRSMREEQSNLSTKLQPLLSRISNADWNIGITNTDVFKGCDYLITKQASQPNQKFRDAILSMGTGGNSVEAGFYKAVQGLSGTCGGQSWVRDNSTLAVLIVSDEDNCSYHGDPNNNNCQNTGSDDPAYLTDYLSSIRTPGTDARVYGIISQPSNPCASADNDGVIYDQVINSTGGESGSICDPSYASTLTSISENISKVLNAQFKLKSNPVEKSVVVKVNDKKVSKDTYKITKNGLVFVNPPEKGAKVSVSYRAETGALNKSFKLSKFAVKDGLKVLVNGVQLDETQFYVDELNQKIVFDKEPEIGSDIEVIFDGEGLAIKRFVIKKNLPTEGMFAEVAGQPTEAFKYDPKTGVIAFEEAPTEGEKIVIKYLVKEEK